MTLAFERGSFRREERGRGVAGRGAARRIKPFPCVFYVNTETGPASVLRGGVNLHSGYTQITCERVSANTLVTHELGYLDSVLPHLQCETQPKEIEVW